MLKLNNNSLTLLPKFYSAEYFTIQKLVRKFNLPSEIIESQIESF